MADEIRVLKPHRSLAAVLVVVSILLLSFALDYLNQERVMSVIQKWNDEREHVLINKIRSEIDSRFETLSERKGAWSLDRPEVLGRIGMKIEELPSYNMDYGDPAIGNGHKE
jgi:hypothetical protein